MASVGFFYECGPIKEVGTGHKYRCSAIAQQLMAKNMDTVVFENKFPDRYTDTLVVDHVFSQTEVIKRAKQDGSKVVLIDGALKDAYISDISISACYNPNAKYKGVKYMAFEKPKDTVLANPKPNTVFVGMGGFDSNNFTQSIVERLVFTGIRVSLPLHCKTPALCKLGNAISFYDDYYKAMSECSAALVNGGLTLYQALYFGLPVVALPQYQHQVANINLVSGACIMAKNINQSVEMIVWLLKNNKLSERLRLYAKKAVDGMGAERIASLIKEITV